MHRIFALALMFATPANAEPPRVVTDIAPVHALAARVMAGVGAPELLVEPGVSPHGFALRPSQARLLADAGVIFWIGRAQTPWLGDAIETLAPGATSVPLIDAPNMALLPIRTGSGFAAHDHGDHDDDGDHGDEHHDDHDDDHDHDASHDHDSENHDSDHAADEHAADDHAEHDHDSDHPEHDHGASAIDPHIWLDPQNATIIIGEITKTLVAADPENGDAYRANGDAMVAELTTLTDDIAARLADTPGGFITFHDAYQYFENRFDFPAAGALSPSDAADPGPARLAALHDLVADQGITCLFAEPQFNPRRLEVLADDLGLKTGTLDPLGVGLEPGSALYGQVLNNLATALTDCLKK